MPKVLIVEDEPLILLAAESAVREAGYDAVCAGSLTDAQACLQNTEVDVLVTDLALHERRHAGFEVAWLATARSSNLPVLYTSGQEVTDGMRRLFVPDSEFLSKPYSDRDLLAALKRLLFKI